MGRLSVAARERPLHARGNLTVEQDLALVDAQADAGRAACLVCSRKLDDDAVGRTGSFPAEHESIALAHLARADRRDFEGRDRGLRRRGVRFA
jgi:hypothetical protein